MSVCAMSKSVSTAKYITPLIAGRVAEFVAVGGGEVIQDCRSSRAYMLRVSDYYVY